MTAMFGHSSFPPGAGPCSSKSLRHVVLDPHTAQDIIPQERGLVVEEPPSTVHPDDIAQLTGDTALIAQLLTAQEDRLILAMGLHAKRLEGMLQVALDDGLRSIANAARASSHGRWEGADVKVKSLLIPSAAGAASKQVGNNHASNGKQVKVEVPSKEPDLQAGRPSPTTESQKHIGTGSFLKEEIKKLHDEVNQATRSTMLSVDAHHRRRNRRDIIGLFAKVVQSHFFEVAISINIVVNFITIAIKADGHIKRPNESVAPLVQAVDVCCSLVFILEITMRVVANGPFFFSRHNYLFKWNIVDSILVLCAIAENLANFSNINIVDVSALRLLGLGRLVRMLPSAQWLRSFSDVRVMLLTILFGLRSMLWAAIVMAFVMLLVSIGIMELVAAEMSAGGTLLHRVSEQDERKILKLYGDMWSAVYTVYRCTTSGLDWGEAADPLFALNHTYGIFFCLFIAFAQICLLNVMTGVFVENASQMSQRDEDTMMLHELETRKQWITQVTRVFEAVNKKKDGSLNRQEFLAAMGEVRIQLLLSKLGIDIHAHRPESLFTLFDYDGNGTVEIEEFASGLHHFHGNARSVDIAKLKVSLRRISKKVDQMQAVLMHCIHHEGVELNMQATHSGGSLSSDVSSLAG